MPKERVIYHRGFRWVRRKPGQWTRGQKFDFLVLTPRSRFRIGYVPFQGHQLLGQWCRTTSVGTWADDALWRQGRLSVKKVKLAERHLVKHLASLESGDFPQLAPLIDHLALLTYEDDTPRRPGFLMLYTEGAQWRAVLKDNDAEAKLPCVGRTLTETLALLVMLLGAEDAPWEPDEQARRMKEKRGKK